MKLLPGTVCIILMLTATLGGGGQLLVDLNTPRKFPEIKSQQDWEIRATEIRQQILVSCGLWPLPRRNQINARVFDRTERDGYTLEKVWLETHSGFFLSGNLYRPLHRKGPFPAVLNPHGHWKDGRLADNAEGSVRARCITFARNGMVAFSYDMAGYNDSCFPDRPNGHRQFATNDVCQLWNINLMGLQTWNSIRALDFLESLPDVDHRRIACTGESGGGTQTFMLGAIDDRLAVQAPVVMVSHIMQGGCLCENAPGLRVEYSNMEIAAAAAPRPQILVAATGDWTRDTPRIEGPAIDSIYTLFNAGDRFVHVQFNYGHNYNLTSREAVYGWFAKWLLPAGSAASFKETNYVKLPDDELRLFPTRQAHPAALTQQAFIDSQKEMHRKRWSDLKPRNKAVLVKSSEILFPAWKHTLLLNSPRNIVLPEPTDGRAHQKEYELGAVRAVCWFPTEENPQAPVAIISGAVDVDWAQGQQEDRLADLLVGRGFRVVVVKEFNTMEAENQFTNFFTTYNRTRLQIRVRALVDLCSAAKNWGGSARKVALIGLEHAGPWALLASPAADAVAADCMGLDFAAERTWLDPNMFCPGIMNIGGLECVALLASPRPLMVYNMGSKFPADTLLAAFNLSESRQNLRMESERISHHAIASWVQEAAGKKMPR